MKNSSFIILFITCTLMIVGCQVEDQVASQRSISPEIPALLTRGSKIQMGKEWTNVQNAYAKLCKDLRKDDGNSQSALSLAMLFIQEARVTGEHGHYYPAALQMINNILKSGSPDDDLRFRSLSAQAGVFLSLHQFDAALEIAKEAVKLNNYNAQIYGVLVDAHVELGDYDMAVRMADKMVSIRPDLRSYSRVSYLREIHGDLEGAIDAMKLAVSAGYPTYEETAWAKLTLGELYEKAARFQSAEALYFDILDHRPNYPFAVAALGSLYLKRGEIEKAEQFIDEACAIIPEVGFYMDKVLILQKTGRKDEAETILREIKEMLADDEKHGHIMNLEYAYLYSELSKEYVRALSYVQEEYQLRPENIDVNKRMATIYLKMNKMDLARKHLKSAAKTKSMDPELISLEKALAMNN